MAHKLLFSCLFGSQLYGTATPASDRDEKHIYLPDFDQLINGTARFASTVSKSNGPGSRSSAGSLDREEIPIQTFARHFLTGQSYAIELAYAVEYTEAEQRLFDRQFLVFCRELRGQFLTREMTALCQYAREQVKRYSFKGARHKVCSWMLGLLESLPPGDKTAAHMDFLREELACIPEDVRTYVSVSDFDTGKGNLLPAIRLLESVLPSTKKVGDNLVCVRNLEKKFGPRALTAECRAGDAKAMMHAARAVEEGITLLSGQPLVFPYLPEMVDRLLCIRRGEVPMEAALIAIDERIVTLDRLSAVSNLPEQTPELTEKFEAWLLSWLKEFYRQEAI